MDTKANDTTREMKSAMRRLSTAGIVPDTIIDVGAGRGDWSLSARKYWRDCDLILIEPLPIFWDALKVIPRSQVIHSAAGNVNGTTRYFQAPDDWGSGIYDYHNCTVPIVALDSIPTGCNLLIKLDTHGHELPILQGARATLEKTICVFVEVYNFTLSRTSLLMHELMSMFSLFGFRLFDLIDIMRRDDGCIWQADAVFLRDSHAIFERKTYSA